MTETLTVDLGPASYQIHVGSGLLGDGRLIAGALAGRKVLVVTNRTVAGRYLPRVEQSLANHDFEVFAMEDGEEHKNLATLEKILGVLAAKYNRSSAILALGGGVVGDTAGFAAAVFQRGIDYVQLPTTLLAQVDSSVGGKTAVNHPLGKNMIGAFHQPKAVVIDVDTLDTLPERELSAGLAEVIKHGLLADRAYLDWVEANIQALHARDKASLTQAILGSCRIKAAVVAEDEKEKGSRALLNLGHTFAHAIETGTGYGRYLHGEAVGIGLVMAADLSRRLGRCSPADAGRIKRLVAAAGLPTAPPESLDAETFLTLMARDKKALDAGLRFVLLKDGPGQAELVDDVPLEKLRETLAAGKALCP